MRGDKGMKKNYFFEGSFSVEASVLMVFVLTGILISILFGLYLHDRTVLEAAARKIALRGSRCITENCYIESGQIDWSLFQEKGLLWRLLGGPDKSLELEAAARKEAEGELLVCEISSFAVTCSGGDVKVIYRARIRLPALGFLAGWWNYGEIQGEAVQKGLEQEELIRLIRGIKSDE